MLKGVFKLVKNNQSVLEAVEITRLQVPLPNLDPGFDGFRLVQISDIHLGTWVNRTRLDEIVDLVNQQEPDVIAITGDFITYNNEQIQDAAHFRAERFTAARGRPSQSWVTTIIGQILVQSTASSQNAELSI